VLRGDAHRAARRRGALQAWHRRSEAALLGCPLVVAARSNRLTAFLLRRLTASAFMMPV
jgi:hypothetical protein